jgi:hypothetical protein
MARTLDLAPISRILVVSLVCLVSAGAARADIYKTIGPDGKMVVSNVAPVTKAGQVMVLKPASSQSGTVHAVPMDAAPRRVQPHALYSSGSETLAPAVVGAVANVMGMSHLVSSARDFCVATSPSALKRYSSAAQGWEQRNAVVVAKKNRLLSTSDRNLVAAALGGDMLRLTEELMRPVRQASTAERIKWCDKTIEEVDRGTLDLVGRASIAPLMNYSLR